jgi:hypothetical protein
MMTARAAVAVIARRATRRWSAQLLVAASWSVAAAQTGGLSVTVLDSGAQPLPGATVTLSHELGYVRTSATLTDARGTALFPVLRAGDGYIVQIEFPGLAALRQEDLHVEIGTPQRLVFQLSEAIEERVRVVAERSVIDLDQNEASTKFSRQFVSDLPVAGRFYQNVLTLAPGVQDTDGDGNPNVHGSRERDFSAMVGGVRNQDPLTGYWMSRVNPNSIEELEVIDAGAGVEFGRAQGGFAVIVQKQGSNEHEGVFELFYRTSKLDGGGADVSTTPDDSVYEVPDFEWWQPAMQLSGPIIRDRLWYRLSHEHRSIEEPVATPRIELTDTKAWTHADQITWQVSPRNKLALSFQADPNRQEKFGLSSIRPGESTWDQERTGETYTLTWTAPFSPKILVESLVAWQDLNLSRTPTTRGVPNECVVGPTYLEQSLCQDLTSGNAYTGSYYRSEEDHSQRLTTSGKATVYGRLWGMSHQLKVGLSIENERYFRELEQRPFGTLDRLPQGITLIPRFLGRVSVPETDDVRATGTNWGLYLEDQLKPLPNLALTLGVRVDREEMHSEGRSQFDPVAEFAAYEAKMTPLLPWLYSGSRTQEAAFYNIANQTWPSLFTGYEDFAAFTHQMQEIICTEEDFYVNCATHVLEEVLNHQNASLQHHRQAEDITLENTNFSPFLAVAWSPGSDGKTALKASAGRHYNAIPLIIPLQELEPVLTELAYVKPQGVSAFELSSGIQPTLTTRTVDRELETPYQDELTVSLERALWPETSIELRWIDRAYRDQIQDVNINVLHGDHGRCAQDKDGNSYTTPSLGAGEEVYDFVTGSTYVDTEPGAGDGRIDDCAGRTAGGFALGGFYRAPDGLADLYVQNPFWGDIFVVGNFNEIDYEAWIVELTRRHYRSWELQASYVWSEARGDGEDFFQELGKDPSLLQSIQGYQSYDQRHVVKLNSTTVTPWGVRLGAALSWQSGLPYSVIYQATSEDLLPPLTVFTGLAGTSGRSRQSYPTGQRNDHRNQSWWNLDLRAAKELELARALNAQLSIEVFNVMDDDTYLVYNRFEKFGQQINGINESTLRYGRRWQLGLRLAW